MVVVVLVVGIVTVCRREGRQTEKLAPKAAYGLFGSKGAFLDECLFTDSVLWDMSGKLLQAAIPKVLEIGYGML